MGIWIRSQDKEDLINTTEIWYCDDFSIHCSMLRQSIKVGDYETKERCLEILDEIQSRMSYNIAFSVYQMPEV